MPPTENSADPDHNLKLDERLAALKQCLATHENLLGGHATISCCGLLYDEPENTATHNWSFLLGRLQLIDTVRVAMDVRIVGEVVRLMTRAIEADDVRIIKDNALVRRNLWA